MRADDILEIIECIIKSNSANHYKIRLINDFLKTNVTDGLSGDKK